MAVGQTHKHGLFGHNITFAYGKGAPVIKDLQLHIKRGEKVGIIGPNGAGKSTLLTLLAGLRTAEGQVTVDGEEKLQKIRERVGLVFQNPDDQLFCQSVYDDIAFGPRNLGLSANETDLRVCSALDALNLNIKTESSSWQLSFGERKLTAIACILALQPRYLALDEPTSNLDPSHRRHLINWLRQTDNTLIITTHDLDMLIGTCHRVLLLDEGHICADGAAESILNNGALLNQHGLELPLCLQQPDWNVSPSD